MAVVSWGGIPAEFPCLQSQSQFWSKAVLLQCSGQEFSRNLRAEWKVFSAANRKMSDATAPLFPVFLTQIKFKLLYSTPTVCTSHKFLCWLTHISLMRIIVEGMGGIWVLLSPPPQTIQPCAFPGRRNSSEGFPSNRALGKVLIKFRCHQIKPQVDWW